MIWGIMQHLGMNMWHDEEIWKGRMKWSNFCKDHLLCTDSSWKKRTDRLLQPGSATNLLVIDVGEGVVYPSHPELAVKGSWSAEKLNAEVKRLKAGGITVVPKLNFSTCHDFWLGDYARMVSTPVYYQAVKEIIEDTIEIFDQPPYFHIGMDEEGYKWSNGNAYCNFRGDELWWHDIAFYAKCIEPHNCRVWMFSNPGSREKTKFYERLPKAFLHSPWSYAEKFAVSKDPGDTLGDTSRGNLFAEMGAAGFDLLPCGSVWCSGRMKEAGYKVNLKNMVNLALFCRKVVPAEHLKGFFNVPWNTPTEGTDFTHMAACDINDIAAAFLEGKGEV